MTANPITWENTGGFDAMIKRTKKMANNSIIALMIGKLILDQRHNRMIETESDKPNTSVIRDHGGS